MAEEHPKATFTWRKTEWKYDRVYTLMGWENVLGKEDLPYEYLDIGPHFWEVGDRIYIHDDPASRRCGKLSRPCVPSELYIGQVIREDSFGKLVHHLREACRRLRKLRVVVSNSYEIVVELDPLPDPVPPPDPGPHDPSVAFDDGVVIAKKPTLLERVRRMIQEVKL